jgi:hypothetical protein
MTAIARRSRTLATSVAAAVVGVLGLAGTPAFAQPVQPLPPQPSPSVLSQTAATPHTALTPAVPITPATAGTLTDFFRDKGVALEPQNSSDFKALNIVLPMPRGWAHVPDPNVADAFAVIADRVGGNGLYSSNAQIVVYKLVGDFDPKEAISHGFVDSQQLPAWRATDGSLAEIAGMPTSTIEGTYRENNMTLNTSRRHVIATTGPDKYLVSLAVTTSVDQVIAAADATDAIVRGFKVSVPAPPGAAAPAAAVPPGQPAPAAAQPAPATPSAALGAQTQPNTGLSG